MLLWSLQAQSGGRAVPAPGATGPPAATLHAASGPKARGAAAAAPAPRQSAIASQAASSIRERSQAAQGAGSACLSLAWKLLSVVFAATQLLGSGIDR